MPPKLRQYLNRTILVSIPALFEDGRCREYILQSIEVDGLWLSATALGDRLMGDRERKLVEPQQYVFVPLTQIAALILPSLAALAKLEKASAAVTPARGGTATTPQAVTAKRGKASAAQRNIPPTP